MRNRETVLKAAAELVRVGRSPADEGRGADTNREGLAKHDERSSLVSAMELTTLAAVFPRSRDVAQKVFEPLQLTYVGAGLSVAAAEPAKPFAERRTIEALFKASCLPGIELPAGRTQCDLTEALPGAVPPEQTNA